MRPGPRRLCAAILLVLTPAFARPAHAHLVNTGFGPFYDGLTHLLSTPEDLLQVIGVALLAGLGGVRSTRVALLALPAAWLAGNVAGTYVGPHPTALVPTAVATIALGLLVAVDAPLSPWSIAAVAIVIGLLGGGRNGVELAAMHASLLVGVGAVCALFLTLSLLGGQVAAVRAPWARIVVRVGGSWIAAIGLFMLGWSLRAS